MKTKSQKGTSRGFRRSSRRPSRKKIFLSEILSSQRFSLLLPLIVLPLNLSPTFAISWGCALWWFISLSNSLSDPTKIPPKSRDRCRNTPVALCFLWYSQTIAATPPLLCLKMAYRNPKTGLGEEGIAEKAFFWSLSRYRGCRMK